MHGNAGDRVLYRAHDEAVEQGHVARSSRSGVDAASWQELEVLENGEKPLLPDRRIRGLNRRECASNATPSVRDRLLAAGPIPVPILRLPNMSGNIGSGVGHGLSTRT